MYFFIIFILKQVVYLYRTSEGLLLLDGSSCSTSDDQYPSLRFCLILRKFGSRKKKTTPKKEEEKKSYDEIRWKIIDKYALRQSIIRSKTIWKDLKYLSDFHLMSFSHINKDKICVNFRALTGFTSKSSWMWRANLQLGIKPRWAEWCS